VNSRGSPRPSAPGKARQYYAEIALAAQQLNEAASEPNARSVIPHTEILRVLKKRRRSTSSITCPTPWTSINRWPSK